MSAIGLCSDALITCTFKSSMDSQTLFGRKVRAVRESAQFSRETMAEKAGINANYLGEIERGEKWPSLEVITALAHAANVSPVDFLEFEAEEVDSQILIGKLQDVLSRLNCEQLGTALRVLKALFRL